MKEFRTILLGQKLRIYTDNKNFTWKLFNINRVILWILIFEEYGPDIEYIKGEKSIVADVPSILTLNGNQETTQKSTYQKKILPEINDIKGLLEGTFSII